MNDSTPSKQTHCEERSQDISLLAAGCLTDREERDLRSHLTTCSSCRDRYEELLTVCSALRAAKPECNPIHFELNQVTVARPAAHQRLVVIAVAAASVLAMLGLLNSSGRRPSSGPPSHSINVAHDVPSQVILEVPSMEPSTKQQPTLMALRQAAAESDEALDRLLAHTSSPMFSQPFDAQSLTQEIPR